MSITLPRGLSPPTDGSVTLPETIDFHRTYNPDVPIYVFNGEGTSHITEITHLEFGRACDRVAHFLRPGRRGPERDVVAIIALSDNLLYLAVIIGIMRAGLIPYPISPRNTAEATIKLLKDTSCHRLLATGNTLKSQLDEIQAHLSSTTFDFALSIEEFPPLHEVYPKLGREAAGDPFEPYPTGNRPSLDDISIYLHSSGSTGQPKTIPQTLRFVVHWASFPPVTEVRDHPRAQRVAAQHIPSFHALGFTCQVLMPLYGLATVGLYPPVATTSTSLPVQPSPQNIIAHTKGMNCTCLFAIPAWLQLWAQDDQVVNFLASLDFVVYGGSSLPTKIGDILVDAGVYLVSIYGGTEFAAPTHFFRDSGAAKDWEYMKISSLTNTRWIEQGDGAYELQFLTCATHQLFINNITDVQGYATSDLFIPHPAKPGLWKIVGRKDDVIIHTSGEKTVPAPIENILISSPYIMGVIMFGRERDQPGVLVELEQQCAIDVNKEQEVINARNLIWSVVEEANQVAPAFSQIYKEFILFASEEKPLPRTGKGTVMRKAALKIYSKEIDEIYTQVAASINNGSVIPPLSWLPEDLEVWLLSQVAEIYPRKNVSSVTGDLFEQGMDSLGATFLRHRIIGTLQASPGVAGAARRITYSTIYNNPSISKLARFIIGTIANPNHLESGSERTIAMENMIQKYVNTRTVVVTTATVLITGTTGSLGSELLDALLRNQSVRKVYALNRSHVGAKSLKQRHEERFLDKGFDLGLMSDNRLVLLEGDTSREDLGLQTHIFEELREVNVVIHNAWRVDFNLAMTSFEPNIRGTRHLIDFARSTRHASSLKFLFTSSVATASSWDQSKGRYPEDIVLDSKYAVGQGYAESKYVADRILAQSGLQSTSFRIGQISGGLPNGAWSKAEWVPILVKSSLSLGFLPSASGVVSWLPAPAVAQILLDVAFLTEDLTHPALNIVHPRPVPWNLIISAINDALVQEGVLKERLSIVEFSEWFEYLETRTREDSSARSIDDVPAIKLIEFFRNMDQVDQSNRQEGIQDGEAGGLPLFSTEIAQTMSGTMKQLPPLDKEDAAMWVKYWKGVGLF